MRRVLVERRRILGAERSAQAHHVLGHEFGLRVSIKSAGTESPWSWRSFKRRASSSAGDGGGASDVAGGGAAAGAGAALGGEAAVAGDPTADLRGSPPQPSARLSARLKSAPGSQPRRAVTCPFVSSIA
ncbi:MAG TPA: hypothetical protein VGP93_07155, partial [Polyangiaceae bacterium]|nr:hypothetical protein [Polyangiaceae bacterium]